MNERVVILALFLLLMTVLFGLLNIKLGKNSARRLHESGTIASVDTWIERCRNQIFNPIELVIDCLFVIFIIMLNGQIFAICFVLSMAINKSTFTYGGLKYLKEVLPESQSS